MKKLVLTIFSVFFILFLSAQDWEQLNFNFANSPSYSFLSIPHIGVSNDNMKIGSSFSFDYGGPMQLSTDQGATWTDVYTERVAAIAFDGDNNVYILERIHGAINYNGSLYKSTDNGQNWEELLDVEDYVETAGLKVTEDGEIYVPATAGLKYSSDGDSTWSDINCPNVPYGVLKTSSGRLIITTYNNGIHYSDDNGASWTQSEGDLGNITFGFLQEHPTNGNIYVCSFGGVLESTDNGASFYLKDPDPWIAMNIKEFEISKAGKFYFYGLYGVYESDDAVTWNDISGNLPAGNGNDMAMTDDHIYVVVDTMIYKREIPANPNGIANSRLDKIETKAFPNPSNGQINIEFNLEKREQVRIQILNLNGETVAEKELQYYSTGRQHIRMELENLPSGMYLANIIGESGTGEKRIEIMH